MLILFEDEPGLYQRQLDSILNLCQLRGEEKLGVKGFFYPVLTVLIRKAQEGTHTLKTLEALEGLISHARDNIRNDEQDQLILRHSLEASLMKD